MPRLYLSPPHLGADELTLVQEAFASNWIAPLGPHVDAFEAEVKAYAGAANALALASGTAGLHLALLACGVGPGDRVWCSTLTFCGSANPIRYCGAEPVFIDSDERSWNCDPDLLGEALDRAARSGSLPKAAVIVDLYGQCADWAPIEAACARHGVALIEDAAEAIGARYRGTPAGRFGRCAVYSFNGNKIITTSGGGMLVTGDEALARRCRHLATQARDPAPWYQHSDIGFNYRLSNVLAAIGRGQLRVLEQRVAARRRIGDRYRTRLAATPGISFLPDADFGAGTRSNRWLTVVRIDPRCWRSGPEDLRQALERLDIESRPVWKPMHLQPVFANCARVGGAVAERLFAEGLCLPSGSAMADADADRVCDALLAALASGGTR